MQDPRQERWEVGFSALANFVTEHGHAAVPARYIDDDGFRLGQWVWVQRGLARRGRLMVDRVGRLVDIGFCWEGRRARNERLVRAVEEYRAKHGREATAALLGRALVLDGQPVASALRSARRRNHLPVDLQQRIDAAGFCFDISRARLAHGLYRLGQFRDSYPTRPVPARYRSKSGFRLGEWVRRMRRAVIAGQVDSTAAARFAELDALRPAANDRRDR